MPINPNQGEFFDGNMGNLHVQPDGFNSEVRRLACHDIGDIDEPYGDITQRYCPDPGGNGKWRTVHVSQGPPERVTTEITAPVGKTSDWLDGVACKMPVYIRMSQCGDRLNFLNYDLIFRLNNNLFSSRGFSNLAMREGTDLAERTFGLSADPPVYLFYPLVFTRQTTTETENLRALVVAGEAQCQGPCGPAKKSCDNLYAGAEAATGVTANVLKTTDRGNTWAATAADPFAADEHISCGVSFPINRTTRRIIVGRGTTDAANPAEIAYSDDGGATWTNVNIGSTVALFLPWSGSLFALDQYHIWAGLDNGDIFFSSDGGLTWTEQVTANANAIHGIHFANENYGAFVGAANTIYKTVDGGAHWTAVTGPAAKAGVIARSVVVLDSQRLWVAYTDGYLYYTNDGGTTWTRRTFTGTVTGIGKIISLTDGDLAFCGYRTVSAAHYPLVGRSFNGGQDFELYQGDTAFDADPTTVTEGLNDLIFCDNNYIHAVGDAIGATGAIYTLMGG